jgi:hypothetical protein
MGGLKVDPEVRGGFQSFGEQPGGFRGHTALAIDQLIDQLIDALNRYTQMGGKGKL